ncbi:hypothetical protein NMG60_11024701 [Bertholletia excelsa]
MECNKDEALRAKEIAEKKFTAKDITGAKKFAAKAQSLYPGLEGIQQMVSTLNVYVSAENRVNGEADWYGILDVNPQADDETVRKQYRKLALMLHPDKNKSVGAEGAFKHISEAWSLLSDKAKRLAYDQKRNAKAFQQKVPPSSGGSAAPPGSNGFYNFAKTTASQTKVQKGNTAKTSASSGLASAHKPRPNTFWTVCHRCKMQYEYLRIYLNHNLLCPNCHDPFLAVETPPPASHVSKYHSQQRQSSNHQGAKKNTSTAGRSSGDSSSHTNFQWFSRAGAPSPAQAATVVQQAYEKVKREREEAQAATKREEALQRKSASKKTGGPLSSGHSNAAKRRKGMEDIGRVRCGRNTVNQMGSNVGGSGTTGSSGVKQGSSEPERGSGDKKIKSSQDLSHLDMRNLLMEKARMVIGKKLIEWKSATMVQSAVEADQEMRVEGNIMINSGRQGQDKIGEPVIVKNESHVNKSSPGRSVSNVDKDSLQPMAIDVPDPDFHDFDKDRRERCFGENQVWAAYDNDDGMPRYYAIIHNVISLNPFKIRISWLNSKTNSELGPLNWVGSGFSKTCGDFRIGKHEINDSLNSFSHKVKWMKGARGVVRIFPRKGDVWALYRNWSPEWNELTADEVIHKYDMVEVLEDYDEELGVTVTPLVKVAGFKTVFHQHLDHRQIRRIPREEMFRFSHHVPSYLLSGQEAPNAPKGCHELDPAATPLELLQVIIDVEEEDIVEKEEKDVVEIEEKGKSEKLENGVGKSNNREKEEDSNGCRKHIPDSEMADVVEVLGAVKVLENKLEVKEDKQVESNKAKKDSSPLDYLI